MEKYDHKKIEAKWQKKWEKEKKLFQADDKSKKEKFYCLDMFPYPSGEGLHVGHVESYTATDIISRYLRMKGKNVMHPQGWDAFGLPAENYAIQTKIHPVITTKKAIDTFKKQMNKMGFSYDWSREVNSSQAEYYRWTQWFFLLFYKNNLAYRGKAKVNWCEHCQTVLANEQAEGGICERCKNKVIQKDLEQWFFKITDFIEDKDGASGLLSGLDKVDWPESTKQAQRNWIGRSTGSIVKFKVQSLKLKAKEDYFLEVFTTRLDTIYGCTYCVVAPEHKLITNYKLQIKNYKEVKKYLREAESKTELERMESKDKTGVELKGIKAINPFANESVPIFVADYVLAHYGTGAVMAVPAHDERDFEFAKKYGLPVKEVIVPNRIDIKNPPVPGKKTIERRNVHALVRNPKNNKFLYLKSKKFLWATFPMGGIKKNEDVIEAARREVKEETGYTNFKFVKILGGEVRAEYFAKHKDENRVAYTTAVLFDLMGEEKTEVDKEWSDSHEIMWIDKDKISYDTMVHAEINDWIRRLKYDEGVYIDDGFVVKSGQFTGLTSAQAREEMTKWLEENNLGEKKINYKLRDWLVSRQRYWGAPIPIIYCRKCWENSKSEILNPKQIQNSNDQNFQTATVDGKGYAIIPVPEDQLPVELPDDVDFKPRGEAPLARSKKFHDVRCPICGAKALRESDTMDTFVCSSWYYFRYTDPKNKKEFASREKIKEWMPVDLYVGGAEHTVLHLLYARFFTKALYKLGYIDFEEPFLKLRHQGTILAEDTRKMSKSFGNVINPDDVAEEYGADALRMFEMFMGPLEDMKPWNTKGIIGVRRFLEKIWRLQLKVKNEKLKIKVKNSKLNGLIHRTIKKVTNDIENMKFNTAISALMILVNEFERQPALEIRNWKLVILLLSPFAPHLTEELWSSFAKAMEDKTQKKKYQQSIFLQSWPEYDPVLVKEEKINLVLQVNGRVRDTVEVDAEISEEEAKKIAFQSEKVKRWLKGKEMVKAIFVKGKLVNVVVR